MGNKNVELDGNDGCRTLEMLETIGTVYFKNGQNGKVYII